MKKKLPMLIGLVCLLIVLGVLYVFVSRNSNEAPSDTKADEKSGAVISVPEDISVAEVTANRNMASPVISANEAYDLGDSVIKIYLDGDSYYIDGYEDYAIGSSMNEYIGGFYELYPSQELKEHDELSVYGLDKPVVSFDIRYSNDSSLTFSVGNKTADGYGYYANTSESDSVYVINDTFAKKYFYGLNDLLDKSLQEINYSEICYVSVTDNTKNENLVITYPDSPQTSDSLGTDKNTLTTLVMEEPVSGLSVYPYNLETTIFSGKSNIRLVNIVDTAPKDLSVYGLENPRYKISFGDTQNTLSFEIGGAADENHSYCRIPESSMVYTMQNPAFEPVVNYNIYEFIERFVDLRYRRDINEADIKCADGKEYTLVFGEDSINEENIDNRTAYLNGHEYSRTELSDFYQLLAGITFERIDETVKPDGDAELVITYKLLDGSECEDAYYNYDANYYTVAKNGEPTGLMVSKSYVSRMLNKAAELTA